MTERPEISNRYSYQEPGPLVQSLLHRYTAPMGVINVTHSQAHFNRLTAWLSGRFPLLAQLKTRRLLEEKFPAVPGAFVFRSHSSSQTFSHSFVNDAIGKKAERGIKLDYSAKLPVSCNNPFLPSDPTVMTNAQKTRGTRIAAEKSNNVIKVAKIDTNKEENQKKVKQSLRTSAEQKITPELKENDFSALPQSDNHETVWRLRRVKGNYPDNKESSSNPKHVDSAAALENNIDQSDPKIGSVSDRFYFNRYKKDINLSSGTIKNKTDSAFGDNSTQIVHQGTVRNLSDSEKKSSEQNQLLPIFSEPEVDKKMIPGSKRVYQLRKQLVKQAKTINQSKISDSVTASRYDYQLPNSTANQSRTTADNPLIWRGQINNKLDSLRQNSSQTNSVTTHVLSKMPELAFLESGLLQPDENRLTAKGQNVKKQNTPIKENLISEFDHARNRLSKREWTQLIDRVSRIILNKLVIDLDRRGIRVWR